MIDPERTYAMLAKPVSDTCNLRCEYCYYTGKHQLLKMETSRMTGEILEAYIRQNFAMPPGIHSLKIKHPVMPFSVTPEGYGKFLCTIYDEWQKTDRATKHVQIFDVTMDNQKGIPSSLCVHNPLCGHSGCVEANGDVFACDRYAFPAAARYLSSTAFTWDGLNRQIIIMSPE